MELQRVGHNRETEHSTTIPVLCAFGYSVVNAVQLPTLGFCTVPCGSTDTPHLGKFPSWAFHLFAVGSHWYTHLDRSYTRRSVEQGFLWSRGTIWFQRIETQTLNEKRADWNGTGKLKNKGHMIRSSHSLWELQRLYFLTIVVSCLYHLFHFLYRASSIFSWFFLHTPSQNFILCMILFCQDPDFILHLWPGNCP